MNSSVLKVLLDTTYLLPILGVEIPDVGEVMEILRALYSEGRALLFYSPFSLLEAIGKIARMPHDPDRVRIGISAITESGVFEVALPSPGGYVEALRARARGFRDLIDFLLYVTARDNGLKFLTRDEELVGFVRDTGGDVSVFLNEDALRNFVSQV